MLVLPILAPVLVMGLLLGAVLLTAVCVMLFSVTVSALSAAGSSVIARARQRRAASREEAVPGPVAIPTRFKEVEDWPEAA